MSSNMPEHPEINLADHLPNLIGEVWNVVKFMRDPHVATNRNAYTHMSTNFFAQTF